MRNKLLWIGLPSSVIIIILIIWWLYSGGYWGTPVSEENGEEVVVENPDRMVSISGTIQILEDDYGSDDAASGSFNKTVFVGNAQPQVLETVPPPKICADEVWVALDIIVIRSNEAGDIRIDIKGYLYEGWSCNTNDLDGITNTSFTVPPNTTKVRSFTIRNTAESFSEDKADITLTVYNGPAPY